ncbi:MAG: cell division topological specificity factor MinE [Candidatus Eremiobacteraeota bacterium]|nr:cell division topological specificity factor MinE [Candidatus Eremiobacteraeota bacterium]
MFEWLSRIFGAPSSSAVAKERLRLVLLSDHLALAPEIIDALRNDLLAVISRYVEVDEAHCDVTFEHQDARIAMLANVPILAVRDRPSQAKPPKPRASRAPSNGSAPRRRRRKAAEAPEPAPAS